MPRPRKSHATRAQLLVLGSQLMTVHGYSGIGLKEILDLAGVPKGSFYNYFSSKEDFAAQVLETYMQGILRLIDHTIDADELSAVGTLVAIHQALITYIRESETPTGCLLGVLAAEVGPRAPGIHAVMRKHEALWIGRYADLMRLGQEQGEVRSDLPATTLAALLWSQWQGALVRLQINQSVDELETTFLAMVELVKVQRIQHGREAQ